MLKMITLRTRLLVFISFVALIRFTVIITNVTMVAKSRCEAKTDNAKREISAPRFRLLGHANS